MELRFHELFLRDLSGSLWITLDQDRDISRYGAARAPPWSQARGWGSHVSSWWPGPAQTDDVGPPSGEPTTHRGIHGGQVLRGLGGGRGGGPRQPGPRVQVLAAGTWDVTSLGEKEPELVWEV